MSIFGQVWLWSLAAFVLGVVITWLALVRPIQTRNRELERALAFTRAEQNDPQQEDRSAFVSSEQQITPPAPTPRMDYSRPFESAPSSRSSSNSSAFADSSWDEASAEGAPHWPEQDSLVDLEQPAASSNIPVDPVLEEQPAPLPTEAESDHRPSSLSADEGTTEAVTEAPRYAFNNGVVESTLNPETPLETTQVLPRRSRRESPRGGFDIPQPVRPSMRAIERREPMTEAPVSGGSLFEPVAEKAVDSPEIAHPAQPRTPFGPGSALARPGGGRPSEEFEIKASATAMRYCTPESPQFDRMVAEVWFRSTIEAERAGFRSLV